MYAIRSYYVDFGEAAGFDDRERVFLTVDDLRFERGIHLGEAHRYRVSAQRGERVDVDRRLDHAQFQPFDIARLGDRTPVVGDLTEAQFHVGQAVEPLGWQHVAQLLAERASYNFV